MIVAYPNQSHEVAKIPTISMLDEMIQARTKLKLEVDTYWIQNVGK